MTRLPTPGGDGGDWGDILNNFLSVENNTDGTLKIRTDGTLSGFTATTGGGKEALVTNPSATGVVGINLASGNVFSLTLIGDLVLTFSGATTGKACSFGLYLLQDSVGSRNVTWPASVKWSHGAVPPLSTAGNAIDILTFESIDGGTTWFGASAGEGFA